LVERKPLKKNKPMKEKIKKIFFEIINWVIVLTAIFFMFAIAPFGFLWPAMPEIQLVRIITIFFSVVLILYLLRRYERKN